MRGLGVLPRCRQGVGIRDRLGGGPTEVNTSRLVLVLGARLGGVGPSRRVASGVGKAWWGTPSPTVITSTVAALPIVAEKSEPANGGIIVRLKPSHVGWPVNVTRISSHQTVTRKYTAEGASFRFLQGGEFIVDARKCGRHRVYLPPKKYVRVTLSATNGVSPVVDPALVLAAIVASTRVESLRPRTASPSPALRRWHTQRPS